jgi:hypothetical protein
MDQAQKAYGLFVLSLEGMAPAGLSAPPERLQSWEELPARVREAWTAATEGTVNDALELVTADDSDASDETLEES